MQIGSAVDGSAATTDEGRLEHEFAVPQRHDRYREEEHLTWRAALERITRAYQRDAMWVYEPYFAGLGRLELDPCRIPTVEAINRRLAPTGWSALCIDGYLPPRVYAGLIARRVFPMSRAIRHPEHLDFSPTPDLVHDVFGHLPLLFYEPYRGYLQSIALLMCRAESSPLDHELYLANRRMGAALSAPGAPRELVAAAEAEVDRIKRRLLIAPSELSRLARMFLWSIEFGLIGTPESYRVVGAGIFSAIGELRALQRRSADVRPYSLSVVDEDIFFSSFQSRYYVFASIAHLTEVLDAYSTTMRSSSQAASP